MNLPSKAVPRLLESKLPLVLADTSMPEFDSISISNKDGAYAAVNHLIGLGHCSIGMINAHPISLPAVQRLEGYKRALAEKGLPFYESLVKAGTYKKDDGFSREAGFEAMMDFIKMGSGMPKAFFISSDIQAIGAMDALAKKGLKVPDDVAIVAFDDIELASYAKLTTMHQPMYEIGVNAVERLVARMANPYAEILHTSFSPSLVIRESCGASVRRKD